jgi:hypothetical protein
MHICLLLATVANLALGSFIISPIEYQNKGIESPLHSYFATEFEVVGNVTYLGNGCEQYDAEGQIVVLSTFGCSMVDKVTFAMGAGAVGIIIRDTGLHPGQKSFSNHGDVLDFPVVEIGREGDILLQEVINATGYVTIQLEPTDNSWNEVVFRTGWFLTVQIVVEIGHGGLLAYAIFKLVRMARTIGIQLNVGFVFLLIEMVYFLIVITLWIDPMEGRFYPVPLQTFLIFLQDTWAFSGLLLMVFFWFETVSSYQGLKTSPFLSRRVRVPFFTLALVLNLLPVAGIIVDTLFIQSTVMVYIGIITAVLILVIAAFYIVVAVKVVRLLNSFVANNKSKNKIRNLRRTRTSIIISCILAFLHPILTTIFATMTLSNNYMWVGFIIEPAVIIGLIAFFQIHFMGVTPRGNNTNTTSSGSDNTQTPRSGVATVSTKSVV